MTGEYRHRNDTTNGQRVSRHSLPTFLYFLFFPPTHFFISILSQTAFGTFGFARYSSRPFAKPKEPDLPTHWKNCYLCNRMQKLKSILLLFIMGMILFPWQLICIAHPFGHNHHKHDGLSPCELHRIAAQQPGEKFLPPMECKHIALQLENFQQPQVEKVKPTIQTLATAAVLLDLVCILQYEQPYLFPPNPKCRSAPILSSHTLRGPPLV